MSAIKKISLDFVDKMKDDHVGAYASQVAYFTLLSAIPFAIFVLSIVQYSPMTYDDLLSVLQTMLPGMASDYAEGMLQQIYERSTIAITSFTILFVLWSAGRALFSVANGINEIYGLKETRNYFHLRFNAMIYTMLLALGITVVMFFLLPGSQAVVNLANLLPIKQLVLFMMSVRLFIIFVLLIIVVMFLYRVLPNTKTRNLLVLPGAVVVSISWIIISYIFAFLFNYTNNFSYMYGSLATIMVMMMWLYFCAYMLFAGAEFNYLITHGNQDGEQLNDLLDS